MLQASGVSRQEQEKNPEAVSQNDPSVEQYLIALHASLC